MGTDTLDTMKDGEILTTLDVNLTAGALKNVLSFSPAVIGEVMESFMYLTRATTKMGQMMANRICEELVHIHTQDFKSTKSHTPIQRDAMPFFHIRSKVFWQHTDDRNSCNYTSGRVKNIGDYDIAQT